MQLRAYIYTKWMDFSRFTRFCDDGELITPLTIYVFTSNIKSLFIFIHYIANSKGNRIRFLSINTIVAPLDRIERSSHRKCHRKQHVFSNVQLFGGTSTHWHGGIVVVRRTFVVYIFRFDLFRSSLRSKWMSHTVHLFSFAVLFNLNWRRKIELKIYTKRMKPPKSEL